MQSNKLKINVFVERWPNAEKPFVVLERKSSFDKWDYVDSFKDEKEAIELALSRAEKVRFMGVRDKEPVLTGNYFFAYPIVDNAEISMNTQSNNKKNETMLKNR